MNANIDLFIEKWLDFSTQLREKEGFNEKLYLEMVELLKSIKHETAGSDSIQKSLAEIFLDMFGIMFSCAAMYQPEEQKQIYQAADHLQYYARDICTS
ncbi:hypothetical protein [Eleftheria terrae]|uniref:hypothetical protein n=1 Tax=Eleftheria terrae TaxID=1597781 RepID=UPI00263BE0D2|nr:hypothetical protein [Eleftheria terrae]WKB54339.1 hypothetical protein N7L95_08115 [Eleftheria terrae]